MQSHLKVYTFDNNYNVVIVKYKFYIIPVMSISLTQMTKLYVFLIRFQNFL